MSTGDVKNNIKQLQHELRAVKYPTPIDVDGLVKGIPKAYLAIYHYLFTSYSTKLNKDIVNSNNELYGKSDMRFMEAVYKILRDMFDYKPQIHREQFFSEGYAERKLIMATDILRLVRGKYRPPKTSSFKITATKEESFVPQKVVQEPVETTRKIASKTQDFAGAVVLPVKTSPGSFKIPKTVLKAHYLSSAPSSIDEHFYPRQSTSELLRSGLNEHHQTDRENDELNDHCSIKIDQGLSAVAGGSALDIDFINSEIKSKIMDSISPSITRLSDRLEKMEAAVQTLHQMSLNKAADETPSSAASLETVLDKEASRNKMPVIDSKKPPICPASRSLESVKRNSSKLKGVLPETLSNSEDDLFLNYDDNDKEADNDAVVVEESDYGEIDIGNRGDGVQVRVVRGDAEQISDDSYQREIEVQVDVERNPLFDVGKNNLYRSEENTADQLISSSTVKLNSKPLTAVKMSESGHKPTQPDINPKSSLFDIFSSPIQKHASDFDNSWVMDQSLASQFNSQEDRRSSTPSHLALDTSTLERVNRINQMMAETQKLFS
ncbi:Centrosomal protein of 44 kDa [Bulinus truncatus]|nr:Centrosomal protein of 44 kDa [Bulinus truncatus]